MKIKVKRFDKEIPIPIYKTPGAVAMDLASREEITIKAGEIAYIPLNIAIEAPKDYWIMIVPRSSTHKLGIMAANSFAIGDSDFSGDTDEYKFIAYNFTKNDVTVEKNTRIAQMMVFEHEKVEIEEVEKLESPNRGGIGTTGFKN